MGSSPNIPEPAPLPSPPTPIDENILRARERARRRALAAFGLKQATLRPVGLKLPTLSGPPTLAGMGDMSSNPGGDR